MADIKEKVYRTALFIDGTMVPTSSIGWNGHGINNLADPSTQQDAATKNCMDQAIVCMTITEKLPPKVQYVDGFAIFNFPMGKIYRMERFVFLGPTTSE